MKRNARMKIKNCKRRGEWAELCFAVRATAEGLRLGRPWGESAGYDFTVEQASGRIVRVQVKSTIFHEGKGYSCTLKDSRGPYRGNPFDFVAAYVIPEDLWYILPVKIVKGMWSIGLHPELKKSKYGAYEEAWYLLREESLGGPQKIDRIQACVDEGAWTGAGVHLGIPGRVGESATAAFCFQPSSDFRERTAVGCDGFRDGMVIDELSFAATDDELSLAENLQMVRDSRGGQAAHGYDLATVDAFGCRRDILKDPKARLVGQGLRYFLNLRTIHNQSRV